MNDKPKILGLIPARGGSKGVPRKNIREIAGKPLIAYTIEAALKSCWLNEVIVSTEDAEIEEISMHYGASVPFRRPLELSGDTSRSTDVIMHALSFFEHERMCEYPLVVYLEPTSPLRNSVDIDNAVEKFLQSDADSLASVVEAQQYHPILMKKIENNRLISFCIEEPQGMPRQLYEPKAYMRNGAVYIFKKKNIDQGILWGKNVLPYIMPAERSACIDDWNDWLLAEALINKIKPE